MSLHRSNEDITSLCIVRLSAIGDVTHMVPIIHSIHKFRPNIKVTWIIGKTEFKLVGDIENVEFIQFDKARGLFAYTNILQQLRGRKFHAVLAAQVSLRANILTALLRADRKIGYDPDRSKDMHGLATNECIEAANEHVLDSFFRFIEHIGIPDKTFDWGIPISADAEKFAINTLPANTPTLAISPCSSHPLRNWSAQAYAEVANYAHDNYQMQTILLGARSDLELEYGQKITDQLTHSPINLIGKDTLKQLLATIKHATVLLSPDSGPAHMATCVDTPVIALHAASNSKRTGPYLGQKYCVDKYSEAAKLIYRKNAEDLKWGTKIEKEGIMDLIKPKDVIIKLDQIMNEKSS